MPRVLPKFGYLPELKSMFVSCHSLWPPSVRCRKEKQKAKSKNILMLPKFRHTCYKRFPGVPHNFNGESWGLLRRDAESLDLPSGTKQPPFSSPSQSIPANCVIFSTAAIEQPWQLLVPFTRPCLLGLSPAQGDVQPWKNICWASPRPTPTSLCTPGRMLSALKALSIPRGSKPSQAILGSILLTSLFSCFSLSRNLITSLRKSLSFSALKPDKQWPNNSAIPLYLVYTFPYGIPARKNRFCSISDINHKPSDIFG